MKYLVLNLSMIFFILGFVPLDSFGKSLKQELEVVFKQSNKAAREGNLKELKKYIPIVAYHKYQLELFSLKLPFPRKLLEDWEMRTPRNLKALSANQNGKTANLVCYGTDAHQSESDKSVNVFYIISYVKETDSWKIYSRGIVSINDFEEKLLANNNYDFLSKGRFAATGDFTSQIPEPCSSFEILPDYVGYFSLNTGIYMAQLTINEYNQGSFNTGTGGISSVILCGLRRGKNTLRIIIEKTGKDSFPKELYLNIQVRLSNTNFLSVFLYRSENPPSIIETEFTIDETKLLEKANY